MGHLAAPSTVSQRFFSDAPVDESADEPPPPPPSAAAAAAAAVARAAPYGFQSRPPPVPGPAAAERPKSDSTRRYVKVDALGRALAVGRRKKAVATVRLWPHQGVPGESEFYINGDDLSQHYHGQWMLRNIVCSPFLLTRTAGLYSVHARADGGGPTGKAEAIRLAISTALQRFDFSLRPPLKKAGFLKVDRRVRERKKAGQRGARAKFAWVKR